MMLPEIYLVRAYSDSKDFDEEGIGMLMSYS